MKRKRVLNDLMGFGILGLVRYVPHNGNDPLELILRIIMIVIGIVCFRQSFKIEKDMNETEKLSSIQSLSISALFVFALLYALVSLVLEFM